MFFYCTSNEWVYSESFIFTILWEKVLLNWRIYEFKFCYKKENSGDGYDKSTASFSNDTFMTKKMQDLQKTNLDGTLET